LQKQLAAATNSTPDPGAEMKAREAALDAREQELQRKDRIAEGARDLGASREKVFTVLGGNDVSDDEKLAALGDLLAENVAGARKEWLVANGRTPYQSVRLGGELSAESLDKMAKNNPQALAGISNDVLQSALDTAEPRDKGRTLRSRISRSLADGRTE
ncbi:MAG: hypothetical protein HN350_22055, partial [Phycisphaerales bacterium]|nr:hypothetical protein [Phycisphaerales bacterium]